MSKASKEINDEEKIEKATDKAMKKEMADETEPKTAEEEDENVEVDPQVFASFKKKRMLFRIFMILSFAWLIGMGIVVMIVDSALLGVIVGVVFVGALVGSIVYGFSSSAVFCPHCQKLLGAEIRTCSNCGNSLL